MRLRTAVALVFVAALALRLVHVADARHSVAFESPLVDAHTYDREARLVAAEGPGALELPYYQPPAYPLLLGAVYAATGGSHLAPRVVQSVAGAATVALVFLLAFRAGGMRAAWIAAAGIALYGPVIYFEGELLPTTFQLLSQTGALVLLAGADRDRKLWRAAAAALLLGVATALRPTGALLAVGAGAWWLLGAKAERARGTAVLLAAFALPVLPFTIANAVGGGEPIAISWNGGINFYLGNGAGSDSLTAIQPGFAWDRLQREPLRAGVTSGRAESAYWMKRGLREAAGNPGDWAAALGRKLLRLLDRRETPRNTDWEVWRSDSRILSLPLVGFGLLAPLAALGLGSRGCSRRLRTLLGVALAAIAVENLAFFVAGRYRVAAVPALAVLAGVGTAAFLREGWRALSVRGVAIAAGVAVVVHVDFLGERKVDAARAAINRGVALRRSGFDAGAARQFAAALREAPDDPDARRWAGETALAAGDLQDALAHFDRALERAPDYLRVLLAKATVLERLGRRPEAESVYRRALVVDPWSTDVRLNYGVYLAVGGRTAAARTAFEQGLRLDPHDGRLRRNLDRLPGGS